LRCDPQLIERKKCPKSNAKWRQSADETTKKNTRKKEGTERINGRGTAAITNPSKNAAALEGSSPFESLRRAPAKENSRTAEEVNQRLFKSCGKRRGAEWGKGTGRGRNKGSNRFEGEAKNFVGGRLLGGGEGVPGKRRISHWGGATVSYRRTLGGKEQNRHVSSIEGKVVKQIEREQRERDRRQKGGRGSDGRF